MQSSSPQQQQDEFLFHPKNVQLFILLAGLSFLFLALTVSYIYIRVTNNVAPVRLPGLFLLNTVILLGSSFTLIRAKRAYLNDDTLGYQQLLKWTIWLSILFMAMQAVAWTWLFTHDIHLYSSTTTGFLYVISIVHFAHVVGGLPFLYLFYRTAKKRMVDPVTVLVYFSDPEKRLRLRLLTIYWHFLDILWIYLVVFFGINQLL
ncbi:MAG TPA: cytochrome c oxidase subunit 3 [Saprospiraceae bacterium]|nr:cytochrome c oxidase subunit 3 [Saprospiraceae bacterium]HPI07408.1 cytochrome c oxidase subunit 3 [Saprospiraceae bacterium]